MTDSNEFPHFDSLFWKRVHDEFVKKGFKCQYDQPIISEVTKFNPPKNLEGDWGETFFNDDWTLNMKIKIVYEASDEDEIAVSNKKSCFELFKEFDSIYEQYSAFANGWNYSIEMVDHIEREMKSIIWSLRLLNDKCPIIQTMESRSKEQDRDTSRESKIRELFEKRKKEIQPDGYDDDWCPIKKI